MPRISVSSWSLWRHHDDLAIAARLADQPCAEALESTAFDDMSRLQLANNGEHIQCMEEVCSASVPLGSGALIEDREESGQALSLNVCSMLNGGCPM